MRHRCMSHSSTEDLWAYSLCRLCLSDILEFCVQTSNCTCSGVSVFLVSETNAACRYIRQSSKTHIQYNFVVTIIIFFVINIIVLLPLLVCLVDLYFGCPRDMPGTETCMLLSSSSSSWTSYLELQSRFMKLVIFVCKAVKAQ